VGEEAWGSTTVHRFVVSSEEIIGRWCEISRNLEEKSGIGGYKAREITCDAESCTVITIITHGDDETTNG
jgi:hypothetical protein